MRRRRPFSWSVSIDVGIAILKFVMRGNYKRLLTQEGLCPTKRFSSEFPLLGKGGVGVVGSTTAQIYSEFDRTTPAPLLCQGGEFSLKPFRWAKPPRAPQNQQASQRGVQGPRRS